MLVQAIGPEGGLPLTVKTVEDAKKLNNWFFYPTYACECKPSLEKTDPSCNPTSLITETAKTVALHVRVPYERGVVQ